MSCNLMQHTLFTFPLLGVIVHGVSGVQTPHGHIQGALQDLGLNILIETLKRLTRKNMFNLC